MSQVVEYDRLNTEGSPGGAAYVSFDNVKVGATMAEVLEPAIDALGVDQPQVVMLNGGEEDNNAFLFRDGYAAVVEARADAGDWAIAADQFVPGWDNANALSLFEQILVAADENVDAVFAANDGLASSVIAALENAGIDPTGVPVSGQDATQAGIQNILLGQADHVGLQADQERGRGGGRRRPRSSVRRWTRPASAVISGSSGSA